MSHTRKYSDEVTSAIYDLKRICDLSEKEEGQDAKSDQALMVSIAKSIVNLVHLVRQEQCRDGFSKEGFLVLFDCMSFATKWQIEFVEIPESQRSDELKQCSADLDGLFPIQKIFGVYNDSLEAICQNAGLDPSLRSLLSSEDVQKIEENLADCSDPTICKSLVFDLVFEGLATKLDKSPAFIRDDWQTWLELYLKAIAMLRVYPREGCRLFDEIEIPTWVKKQVSDFILENACTPVDIGPTL